MRRCRQGWKRAFPWILLLSLLSGVCMAVYVRQHEPPMYETCYTLYAIPAAGDIRSLAEDCYRLTRTSTFQQAVLANVYSDGRSYVDVRAVRGAHMLEVIVSGPDASVVQNLANAAGEELCLRMPRMFGAQEVHEVQKAMLPMASFVPHVAPKAAAASVAVFALLSLLACCFAADYRPLSFEAPQAEEFRLGAVGDMRDDVKRFLKQRRYSSNGTLLQCMDRLIREDIRQLVLRLRGCSGHQSGYSVVLSAMRNHDEDAVVTVLLASELAQQGFRVLLMEMDGQQPELEQLLGLRTRADLYDYMKGRAALHEVVTHAAPLNLSFISSLHPGVPVADIAATQTFSQFVQSAKEHFDFVLLHAAPRACCCDAAMLSLVADSMILIARDQTYSLEEIEAAAREMARLGKPARGVIFTCVRSA